MYIMLKGQPMLYPSSLYIFQCENIVSSFILVRRLAMPDVDESRTSLTLSFLLYLKNFKLTLETYSPSL